MYNLRRLNNNYEGGARSDFILVKHPEYALGKIQADKSYGPGYDLTPIPHHPAKSPAVARLRRAGSESLLTERLQTCGQLPYKERSLSKDHEGAVQHSREALAADYRGDFDKFLVLLKAPETIPAIEPLGDRITSGCGNHIGSQGTCKHYAGALDELKELVERLKRDPVGTERDLLVSGSWKYHANRLEQARRRQILSKKQREAVKLSVTTTLNNKEAFRNAKHEPNWK